MQISSGGARPPLVEFPRWCSRRCYGNEISDEKDACEEIRVQEELSEEIS
jgi:hypothetical protein